MMDHGLKNCFQVKGKAGGEYHKVGTQSALI